MGVQNFTLGGAKTIRWNAQQSLVASEWDWFWKHALIAMPLWSGGGDVLRNYGKFGPRVNLTLASSWQWETANDGIGLESDAAVGGLGFNMLMDDPALPTVEATIAIRFHKLDGTDRNSGLIGATGTGFVDRFGVHAPESDGTMHWDFGSTDANGRLSASGQTMDDALWCFCGSM